MASRWFYRVFDQEMGPVGFKDLAEMVRTGTLTEDDRVRREFSEEWTAARDVIGLFRSAQASAAEAGPAERAPQPNAPEAEPQSSKAPTAAPTTTPRRWRVPRVGPRAWIAAAVVLAVAGIVGYELWANRKSRVFPESALKRPRPTDSTSLEAILGPRPKTPSIPGLEERKPMPIPGLESIDPGFSPCLTPDLKTIVFAHAADWATAYDLYIATRDDVTKPFGPPKLIKSCQSRRTDAYPSLSPDGLELMFVREDDNPQFFRSRRSSASDEFGDPVAWPVKGHNIVKPYLQRPQFIGPRQLTFCIVSRADDTRTVFVAERRDASNDFGPLQKLTMTDPWPPYHFLENGLRAYCPSGDGIFFVNRGGKGQAFGPPVRILDAALTGPIDGPFWVAPREDVAFYVSSGPGQKPGPGPGDKGRKLWMIRF